MAYTAQAKDTKKGDSGLYTQDWFLESFLELKEDLQSARENNKFLAIIFEQRGCPYCRALHEKNFANEKIKSYLKNNFDVLQLDLWGSRKVTDFDGKELEEREIARRWRVNFTPTMVFFSKTKKPTKSNTGLDLEVFRMPGYFKPFHFLSMLEFIKEGHFEKKSFQKYLQEKFRVFEKKGIKPNVW